MISSQQKTFLEYLLEQGLIDRAKHDIVRKAAEEERKDPMEVIFERRLVEEKPLMAAKSRFSGFPIRDMAGFQANYETLREVPEEAAKHHRFFSMKIDKTARILAV